MCITPKSRYAAGQALAEADVAATNLAATNLAVTNPNLAATHAVPAPMHRPKLFLFAVTAAASLAAPIDSAIAEDKIAFQTYKYVESGGRIKVVASDIAVEKDFGTDLTVNVDVGVDTISGATPAWRPKPGYVNEYVSGLAKYQDEVRNSMRAGALWRDAKRNEYSVGFALSREPDFYSRELSAQVALWQDEKHNRSYIVGASFQLNTNIANQFTNNPDNETNRVVNIQAGVNQVIDSTSSVEASVYTLRSEGYLSHDYLKIVRDNGAGANILAPDSRPGTRSAGGVSVRWIKSWSDDLKTNLWFRNYSDTWGVRGNTIEAKAFYSLSEKWRFNPVVRYHQQQGANFYRAYGAPVNTFAATGFGTNDARQGPMKAVTVQLNTEYRASKAWAINTGVVHYKQDSGLKVNWVTLGFVYKY